MTSFGDEALAGLKGFQRATVEYVVERMFDENQRRFLVADEVGLGKTLVARGIVGRAIERLEADNVKRIDVIYVCSNAEIARQNVRKLKPPRSEAFERAERITLLPLHVHNLKRKAPRGRSTHNFVSFTPGTMPDRGHRTGWARERALIYLLLAEAWDLRSRKGPKRLLQATTRTLTTFEAEIANVRAQQIDADLKRRFVGALRKQERETRLRERFEELAKVLARREARPTEREERNRLVSELRWQLARVCVDALEPDLVILDEFQRFRDLLDGESDAALLARALFEHGDARVLLLSATPYRMFTTSDEAAADNHHRDFARTIRFLFGADAEPADEVAQLLDELRLEALRVDGRAPRVAEIRTQIEHRLRRVIVRTEKLAASEHRGGMLDPVAGMPARLDVEELSAFVAIRGAAREAGDRHPMKTMEYWKSAPYLLNLMDGYQLKQLMRDAAVSRADGPKLARRLRAGSGLLPFDAVREYRRVEPGNARMRTLFDDSVDADLWRLLWLPPTLPYYAAESPFDRVPLPTKRLVFSSWNVVPKAIAGLVSYEAERRMIRSSERSAPNTPESRVKLDRRLLDFKTTKTDRPTAMPTLALLYPSFALAKLADPLELRSREAVAVPTLREAIEWARTRVESLLDALPYDDARPPDPRWFWAAPIMLDANDDADAAQSWLGRPGLAEVWSEGKGDPDVDTRDSRWRDHVELAARVAAGEVTLGQRPEGLLDVVAQLALAGPGVSALRALSRVRGRRTMLADPDLRDAAAAGAWPLRTLLSHPESIALVRSVVRSGPYWRRALAYCTRGGLQSVLDEYVHVVNDLRGLAREPWADAVWQLAGQLRVSAGLKTAAVVADEVTVGARARTVRFKSTAMRSRFSARYGEAREAVGEERTRAESLRDAFNSPFWPFVLATTSVGQEGLDFHAYCHAVVHWNLPSNPVDLEQREGRVHRYKGHAVRKNVAAAHAEEAFRRVGADPWAGLFDAASESVIASDDPDIVPFWVYPGEARIQRHVPMLPFSRDEERYRKLKRSLGLYRMVLGQPRQEDLIELLSGRFDHVQAMAAELRVDLSPPRRAFSPKHGLGLPDPNKSKGEDDGATAR